MRLPATVTRLRTLAEQTLPGRCVQRYLAIKGTVLGLMISGHAFSAFIPLLIVVASVLPGSDAADIGDGVIQRFRLSGSAAEAVRTLFARPPDSGGALALGGIVLLIFSSLSLARSLQRAYEAAWQLPPGLRGTLNGAAALSLLLTQLLLLSLLASMLRGIPAGSVITFVIRVGLAVGLWLLLQHLLLGGRVQWRLLVPGAIAAAAGQQALSLFSAVWMPNLIERNADRYGVIGVTFALLSWLTVLGIMLVAAAVIGAELGGAKRVGEQPQSEPPIPEPA
ncbi:MAG TPA: YhjD/YihY/BrkB family envelope integrity protein [Actinomycetes bacterium]|nr:YhjD/YihY/BrkB family envelope integrity protein [Actinomycetes bacterium]